jgi:hypothetical protein
MSKTSHNAYLGLHLSIHIKIYQSIWLPSPFIEEDESLQRRKTKNVIELKEKGES